jgi:hypothetical protein
VQESADQTNASSEELLSTANNMEGVVSRFKMD